MSRTAQAPVDFERFAADLLSTIEARRISLRQAAREAHVPPMTLSRVTTYAVTCNLTTFARLCLWAGLIADSYIGDRSAATPTTDTTEEG